MEVTRILAGLRAEFADANTRLATEFDLDLSSWNEVT